MTPRSRQILYSTLIAFVASIATALLIVWTMYSRTQPIERMMAEGLCPAGHSRTPDGRCVLKGEEPSPAVRTDTSTDAGRVIDLPRVGLSLTIPPGWVVEEQTESGIHLTYRVLGNDVRVLWMIPDIPIRSLDDYLLSVYPSAEFVPYQTLSSTGRKESAVSATTDEDNRCRYFFTTGKLLLEVAHTWDGEGNPVDISGFLDGLRFVENP